MSYSTLLHKEVFDLKECAPYFYKACPYLKNIICILPLVEKVTQA